MPQAHTIAALAVLLTLGCSTGAPEPREAAPDTETAPSASAEPDHASRYVTVASELGCIALARGANDVAEQRQRILQKHDLDDAALLKLAQAHAPNPSVQARITAHVNDCLTDVDAP